jgi:hypothetical protein
MLFPLLSYWIAGNRRKPLQARAPPTGSIRRLPPPATASQFKGVRWAYSIGFVFTRLWRFRHFVSSENAGSCLVSRRLTEVRFRDGGLVDAPLGDARILCIHLKGHVRRLLMRAEPWWNRWLPVGALMHLRHTPVAPEPAPGRYFLKPRVCFRQTPGAGRPSAGALCSTTSPR